MIKKVILWIITASALATAVGVALVAAAFAVYSVLLGSLGAPGAAGAVAGGAALIVLGFGLFSGLRASGRLPTPEPSLVDKLTQIAREKPMLAAGGALLAGLVALKNPKLAAGLASAFMAGKAAEKVDPPKRRW